MKPVDKGLLTERIVHFFSNKNQVFNCMGEQDLIHIDNLIEDRINQYKENKANMDILKKAFQGLSEETIREATHELSFENLNNLLNFLRKEIQK